MPEDIFADSCQTCVFFFPTPKGMTGHCRRFPPSSTTIAKVQASEWCGEFKADAKKQEGKLAQLALESKSESKDQQEN